MKYRFKVEYKGKAFHGWQVQPNAHTVQAEIEKAFKVATGDQDLEIWGSGRTDAGVNARGQVAVAVLKEASKLSTHKLERAVNGISNYDVMIRDLEVCSDDFNPRFDATSRYYIYTIFTRSVVMGKEYGWDLSYYDLDLDLMSNVAKDFIGTHDFDPFSIPRNDGKSTDCTLTRFEMEILEDRILWHIEGNRFLHKMVRSMVGILSDIGRAKHPKDSIEKIFDRSFSAERTWAPPQGLCLEKVKYPNY